MRAVIYCRISRDRTGEAAGVQRQEDDCRALCERAGWDVAATLVDNDVSAYKGKRRPGWQQVTDLIRSREVDVLVGWHPDRFTRRMRELEDLVELVETAGVTIATVTAGSYDLATPSGRLVARNLGAAARYESEHKAERQRRKHVEIAAAGRRGGGGNRPFGYTGKPTSPGDPPQDQIVPAEAELIRDATRRLLAGESMRSILREWNERGVPTVKGAPWQAVILKRVLCSARISGQREHQGRIVGPAVWPAIITPEETARLRALILDPQRRRTTKARSYLLSGLVHCGVCGARMTSRPTKAGRHRYVCTPDHGGCNKCGISAEGLEGHLSGLIVKRLSTRRFVERVRARPEHDDRAILDAIATDEATLEQLATDHYVDRVIGRGEYLAARQSLEARIAAERRRLVRTVESEQVAAYSGALADVRARWDAATWDQQRSLAVALVERVDIAGVDRSANRFDADRAKVTWRRP